MWLFSPNTHIRHTSNKKGEWIQNVFTWNSLGDTCLSLTHKPFLARPCCSKVLAWRQFNRQLQKKASTAKVASPSNVKIDASYRCTKQSQRLSGHTVFVHMTSTVLNIIFFSSYLLTKKKLNAYCSVHWVNRNVCSHYKLIN